VVLGATTALPLRHVGRFLAIRQRDGRRSQSAVISWAPRGCRAVAPSVQLGGRDEGKQLPLGWHPLAEVIAPTFAVALINDDEGVTMSKSGIDISAR
jgi:hypothetical protein